MISECCSCNSAGNMKSPGWVLPKPILRSHSSVKAYAIFARLYSLNSSDDAFVSIHRAMFRWRVTTLVSPMSPLLCSVGSRIMAGYVVRAVGDQMALDADLRVFSTSAGGPAPAWSAPCPSMSNSTDAASYGDSLLDSRALRRCERDRVNCHRNRWVRRHPCQHRRMRYPAHQFRDDIGVDDDHGSKGGVSINAPGGARGPPRRAGAKRRRIASARFGSGWSQSPATASLRIDCTSVSIDRPRRAHAQPPFNPGIGIADRQRRHVISFDYADNVCNDSDESKFGKLPLYRARGVLADRT
jgi:hypothetical protein